MLHHRAEDLVRILGIYNTQSACDLNQSERFKPFAYLFSDFCIQRLVCLCEHQFVGPVMTLGLLPGDF